MAMIIHKKIGKECALGVWQITEDYDTLLSLIELSQEETDQLNNFRNHNRKLEWLSVRALTRELTGSNSRIIYNHYRKPSLMDDSYRISISHSRDLTAVLIARNKRVGIDLEFMSHRISKIADKFINESEKITHNPVKLRYHLYIHWCAKESLYKICDKQGLNFRENLIISPFVPAPSGVLQGMVTGRGRYEEYELNYFRKNNYIIVWCCK
jgi:4'-phosphopantetheinyl transferase